MSIKNDQYLLFLIGEDTYGVEALKAQEIVGYENITKIPMMSSYVSGVTNIRGNIVPVIDLLDRFGLGKSTISEKTSIVVINYENEDESTQIGVIIDEVFEVETITGENIKSKAAFGSKIDIKFINQMGKYRDDYIPLLDVDAILDYDDLSELVQTRGEK